MKHPDEWAISKRGLNTYFNKNSFLLETRKLR